MRGPLKLLLCCLSLCALALAQIPQEKLTGRWAATVSQINRAGKPVFDVPFEIVLERDAHGLKAALYNGPERMDFSSAEFADGVLTLSLNQYDGRIRATLNANNELTGGYVRQTRIGVREYPFRATRQTVEKAPDGDWQGASLGGEWVFTFAGADNPDKVSPANFQQQSKARNGGVPVNGTVAPVSGDYGLMSGQVRQTANGAAEFSLSRFDGIHLLLLKGKFTSPDAIEGDLSGEAFTAVRKGAAKAAMAAPESLTRMKNAAEPLHFSGVDVGSGAAVNEQDARFKGKVLVVDIFGTWCPNCHDEAPLLQEMWERYHSKGLEIVGLAYEYTDDRARNVRQIEVYRKRFGIKFPLLISGTTDEGQIAKTLPQLESFYSYPTTIFVGRDGKVKRIHSGFSGPATGKMDEVRQSFEQQIKELLQ